MPGAPRMAAGPVRRLTRLLRPNPLRRPSDRSSSPWWCCCSAAFLAAASSRPSSASASTSHRARPRSTCTAAVAVLTGDGPYGNGLAGNGWATARWRAPDGQPRTGTLTTLTAPDIWNASPGTRVPVWLTSSGAPAVPPPGPGTALFTTVSIVMLAGITLMICYWLCRVLLDRRRLAAWESAWARTRPRWRRDRGWTCRPDAPRAGHHHGGVADGAPGAGPVSRRPGCGPPRGSAGRPGSRVSAGCGCSWLDSKTVFARARNAGPGLRGDAHAPASRPPRPRSAPPPGP